MIISAFQGIGKTTLAKSRLDIIDFESSSFDKSNPNWYVDYCKAALDLDKQGYIVFVSSHNVVRDYLVNSGAKYFMIMYSKDLKDFAVDKVKVRYEQDPSEKNKRAMDKAAGMFDAIYDEVITDTATGLQIYLIDDKNYNLGAIVDKLNRE